MTSLKEKLFPSTGKTRLWVLLDPDKGTTEQLAQTAQEAEASGADLLLVGGSYLVSDDFDGIIKAIKAAVTIPVILFPGGHHQVSRFADGILFMSLLSGRNPQYLVGEQLHAAPLIRKHNLPSIPTAYLLIESGCVTSAQFISGTLPIPRHKPGLVAGHALMAELMGMQCVYLEAGSGAELPVPPEVIRAVKKTVQIPVIAGGGITNPEKARLAATAGADAIVIGTVVENKGNGIVAEIASALK